MGQVHLFLGLFMCVSPAPATASNYDHSEEWKQTPCTHLEHIKMFSRRAWLRCISPGRSPGKSGDVTGGSREGAHPRDAPEY